jgi:diguanylate cyclase (GGDEF)-like protein
MQREIGVYSLPRWRLTRWLTDAGPGVPDDIRVALVGSLFGTLPVFAGGVINTVAVSAAIAIRQPTALFIAWLILEIAICLARLIVLVAARRAARAHCPTPTDIYLLLGIAWSVSVGYGVVISMASGDWVIATVACTSAAAMVGGICFRNFSAPRLAATMILLSLGPCIPGALLAGEPLIYIAFLQVPLYLAAMTAAAFKLNKMLVATMRGERENDHRARHDPLTGLSNRTELVDAIASGLGADRDGKALALLFLDLDDFKAVNDTFGHVGGDRLLKMVAERLQRALPAGDLAARIGGDEFVVLAAGLTHEQACALGQRLIHDLVPAYKLGDGMTATIGVSVGIAMAPEHGRDPELLLAVADAALYEAKSNGKSRCCIASVASNLAALQRLHRKGVPPAKGIGVAA